MLEGIELASVILDDAGIDLQLHLRLQEFPDHPPDRWVLSGYNKVTLTLNFFNVHFVQIIGWSRVNLASVNISRTAASTVNLSVDSSTCSLRAHWSGMRLPESRVTFAPTRTPRQGNEHAHSTTTTQRRSCANGDRPRQGAERSRIVPRLVAFVFVGHLPVRPRRLVLPPLFFAACRIHCRCVARSA